MKSYRLNNDQLKALSGITADIGQAIFASAIIPFAFQLGKIQPIVVASGLIISFGCWILTLYLVR